MINEHRLMPRIDHDGFPYSRDFAMHIPCETKDCIANNSLTCGTPSLCEIDNWGRCKWYLKQKEKLAEKKDEPSFESSHCSFCKWKPNSSASYCHMGVNIQGVKHKCGFLRI